MTIQNDSVVRSEIKALYRRLEELEQAVLELTSRVRWLETTPKAETSQRPTLSLKKDKADSG